MKLSRIKERAIQTRLRLVRAFIKPLMPILGNEFRIYVWRKFGARIGERCRIKATLVSAEAYLIELGNDVIIAANTDLITVDGAVTIFRREDPQIALYGTIKVGNNTFIGTNALLLPNTQIGSNCVIGAGSVVRGRIPDNSVVFGNPAEIIMSTEQYKKLVYFNPTLYKYKRLTTAEKKRVLLEKHKIKDVDSAKPGFQAADGI